jgi:hypothetical protein
LRDIKLGFSENDIDKVTVFAIRGSRRIYSGDLVSQTAQQKINPKYDLIQFNNFEKALGPVINHMRREIDEQRRKQESGMEFE